MEGSTKYATFFLIFSIVFTYYSYALAFTVVDEARWDISLSYEEILSSGIMLGEADELNITYEGGYYYFSLNNTEIRVEWLNTFADGDHFWFQSHVKFFGVGIAWTPIGFKDQKDLLYNSTIIAQWNNETQWSRFSFKNGYELFFTDPALAPFPGMGNMTRAILEDGFVTATIAESITFTNDVNLLTFVTWYAGMITGTNDYGLPSVLNIVLQVINVLSLLSVIILAKEMIRL